MRIWGTHFNYTFKLLIIETIVEFLNSSPVSVLILISVPYSAIQCVRIAVQTVFADLSGIGTTEQKLLKQSIIESRYLFLFDEIVSVRAYTFHPLHLKIFQLLSVPVTVQLPMHSY